MNDKKLLITITIISLIIISSVFFFAFKESEQGRSPGHDGRIVAEKIHLSSKIPGRLSELYIDEGDTAEKGKLLARLDVPELIAKKEQAQAAADAAQAQFDMAKNGATVFDVARAKSSLEAATAQYSLALKSKERLEAMYSDSLIAAQEYDEMITKYRAAKAQQDASKTLLDDLKSGTREEKIRMAESDLRRALAALKEVESLLEDQNIVAPRAMIIESISLKTDELAPAGYTIISGYSPAEIYARFSMPESEIVTFRVGSIHEAKLVATSEKFSLQVQSIRKLPTYATRSSAYPARSFDEKWFEVRMVPVDDEPVPVISNGQSVVIK